MKKKEVFVIGSSALIVLALISAVGIYLFSNLDDRNDPDPCCEPPTFGTEVEQFQSEEEFRNFLESKSSEYERSYGLGGLDNLAIEDSIGMELLAPSESKTSQTPDRYSTTNTQVLVIDEADIVKTDGKDIYYSEEGYFYPYYDEPFLRDEGISSEEFEQIQNNDIASSQPPPEQTTGLTRIISAFPPSEMDVVGEVPRGGQLYVADEVLIIGSEEGFIAYDVTDPKTPDELWKFNYADETYLVTSRMYNDELYLITGTYIHRETPCAIPLLEKGGNGDLAEIHCTDLYYPQNSTSTDKSYTALKVDPTSGEVIDKVSFLGSSYNSLVYMSENNIYFTYPSNSDHFTVLYTFIIENEELFSDNYIERVKKLNGYEISQNSKLEELSVITNQYLYSLDDDERLAKETEIINRMDNYSDKHIRDLSGTGIIKINNSSLDVLATGSVPGTPLDQFSLDEYDGYLRIATNVDPYSSGYYYLSDGLRGSFTSVEEENDVIVLNDDLEIVGEVRGLGIDEEIYSTRFIGDVAYVVTFKQIDPFYVIDLSFPSDPLVEGELKIPGYSSYLHPLSKDLILGVGEENFRVKLSLFDVSDPTDPIELSKYSLGENWTEVESNHHAFLHDPEHKVFFIPTSEGGYVISYEGNKFEIAKTIAGYDIQRAIYINDFMYIIGRDGIVVLDENTWEKVNDFKYEETL